MTREVTTLIFWNQCCLMVAALCTSAFPIFYAFSPWYKSRLGWLIMVQAVAFAAAMDLTVLGQLWPPTPDNLVPWLWVQFVVISLIAIAAASLTVMLWKLRHDYKKKLKQKELRNEDPAHVQPSL